MAQEHLRGVDQMIEWYGTYLSDGVWVLLHRQRADRLGGVYWQHH